MTDKSKPESTTADGCCGSSTAKATSNGCCGSEKPSDNKPKTDANKPQGGSCCGN